LDEGRAGVSDESRSTDPAEALDAVTGEIRRIGRYDLIEKIGRGGMGVVYRAKDSTIGRPVAVKMLISDIDISEEARERFYREARSAGQLAHRNIITIYDFGEDQGRAYIVMELLNGESLAGIVSRRASLALPRRGAGAPADLSRRGAGAPADLSIEQQIEIMARTCEGLAFAHARGIVHRDIKPANLFVTNDGQIKILDFGVARIASSKLTRSGFIVGTPDYMSPEQVMGKPVDQRSDVFSVGTVFYELLTGRRPFGSRKLPEILNNVVLASPQPLTETEAPAALAAVVTKALEKDPAQRYQRMVDMLVALTGFVQAWERRTRELALEACDAYRENERLLAARDARRPGAAPEEVAAAPLLRHLPMFQDRGADVLKVVPFRRAKIVEIMTALQAQHARLSAEADA
jgi:serine/threonine-protein kinase